MGVAKNQYKVPASQWRKWDEPARVMFNWLYSLMAEDQKLFSHPKAAVQKTEHWQTTAWNAAWLAADGVMDVAKEKRAA